MPVFPAVYGGYMLGFGAIFTVEDLVVNTDSAYATRLAAQFVHGAQLGWMSLGGTSDSPPMGLYDYLMQAEHEAEVEWLASLGKKRGLLSDYFLHGREMRLPPFVLNVTYNSSSQQSQTPAALSSAWLLNNSTAQAAASSLLLLLVTPDSTIAPRGLAYSLCIDLTDFGFPSSANVQQWSVRHVSDDGRSAVHDAATVQGGVVMLAGSLSGRSVLALTVQHSSEDERLGRAVREDGFALLAYN